MARQRNDKLERSGRDDAGAAVESEAASLFKSAIRNLKSEITYASLALKE